MAFAHSCRTLVCAVFSFLILALPSMAKALSLDASSPSSTFVVLIGNKDYRELPDVEYAHNDVDALQAFYREVEGVPESNFLVLKDADITRFRYLFEPETGALHRGLRAVGGIERLVVYYSGHGSSSVDLQRQGAEDTGVFIATGESKGLIEQYSLSRAEMLEKLSLISNSAEFEKPLDVVVMLDSCFTGDSAWGELFEGARVSLSIDKGVETSGITVLAGASNDQIANSLPERKLGLFTASLLDTLYGLNNGNQAEVKLTTADLVRQINNDIYRKQRSIEGSTPQSVTLNLGGDTELVMREGPVYVPDRVRASCQVEARRLMSLRRSCAPAEIRALANALTCPSVEVEASPIYGRAYKAAQDRLATLGDFTYERDGLDQYWTFFSPEEQDAALAEDYIWQCDELNVPEGCAGCSHLAAARALLDPEEKAWAETTSSDTIAAYVAFLATKPEKYESQAKAKLAALQAIDDSTRWPSELNVPAVASYLQDCLNPESCGYWDEGLAHLKQSCGATLSLSWDREAPYSSWSGEPGCSALYHVIKDRKAPDVQSLSQVLAYALATKDQGEMLDYSVTKLRDRSDLAAKANFDLGWVAEASLDPRIGNPAHFYVEAFKQGHPASAIRLASLYWNGKSVQQDTYLGMAWTMMAYAIEPSLTHAAKVRSEASEKYPKDLRYAQQIILKEAGYYTSSLDGQFGPGSRRALEAWVAGSGHLKLAEQLLVDPKGWSARMQSRVTEAQYAPKKTYSAGSKSSSSKDKNQLEKIVTGAIVGFAAATLLGN